MASTGPAGPSNFITQPSRGETRASENPNLVGMMIFHMVPWVVCELLWSSFGGVPSAAFIGMIQGAGLWVVAWWNESERSARYPRAHYWAAIAFYLPPVLLALGYVGFLITGAQRSVGRILLGMAVGAGLGLVPALIAYRKGRDPIHWWMFGAALWIVAMIHVILIRPRGFAGHRPLGTSRLRFGR